MRKRITAPTIGGIFTPFVSELLAYPAMFALCEAARRDETKGARNRGLISLERPCPCSPNCDRVKLTGMESPDTRRKADDSYQPQFSAWWEH